MNEPYTPQAAAEKARETFKKASADFEAMARDATVPESVRALAEKTVTQTREAYEKAKDALDDTYDQGLHLEAMQEAVNKLAAEIERIVDGDTGTVIRAFR